MPYQTMARSSCYCFSIVQRKRAVLLGLPFFLFSPRAIAQAAERAIWRCSLALRGEPLASFQAARSESRLTCRFMRRACLRASTNWAPALMSGSSSTTTGQSMPASRALYLSIATAVAGA